MKLIRIIAMLLALTVAILTVASAYAGSVNPQSWALPSVLAMIFPAMLLLTVILTILNLFICRKAAIVSAVSLLSEPAADGKPLTLLTYNVMQLTDFTGTSAPDSPNPTLRMLASSEADIIALQECYDIASIATGEANRPLLDSISRHYPYRSYGARGQSLLSRFPFDEIILSRPNADDFRVRAFRIYIGADTITLFDVHLQSIGLTPDDKQLYRDLTRGDTQGRGIKGEIREIRSDLISKLTAAFRARALQTAALTDMIAETGGKCGSSRNPGAFVKIEDFKC
ncbi:endonuclease/exonuclease/phosphatase family protein [Paramuribaculum intestinale]|uniref:endonuclease/exonuclease/phosphatase family protein n=1 Tax=Paramuribaculum intestinale TaxID=2094151 RepID=UPI0025B0A785|nr:endonuclease/exonuclease/phosphatase family protein [Paramuribaculum intestinale]